jgi:hypothetical protein
MLTLYFQSTHVLRQLRSGPVGPYLDGFAKELHAEGYTCGTARPHLRTAAHFGVWVYTRADPSEKFEALDAVVPPSLRRGQFRPPDKLIAMLKAPRTPRDNAKSTADDP